MLNHLGDRDLTVSPSFLEEILLSCKPKKRKKGTFQEIVKDFFQKYKYYCGGPIPEYMFDEIESLQFVTIEQACDIVHSAISKSKSLARSKLTKYAAQKLLVKIIHKCENNLIPQEFAPGIILLYIELIEGCNWRHLVNDKFELCGKVRLI